MKYTKPELNKIIDEMGLSFRYFENEFLCCSDNPRLSVGWRQNDDYIEFAISIRNRLDNHCRQTAKENIIKRFNNNQTLQLDITKSIRQFPNALTPNGKIRNDLIVQIFKFLHNNNLLEPKKLGFSRFITSII